MSHYLAQPTPSFWRSLQYLSDSRLIVAALLLAYVPVVGREVMAESGFNRPLFLKAALGYVFVAVFFSIVIRLVRRSFHTQLLTQILTDIVVIGVIVMAAGGAKSGLGVLMMTPTAGAAILTTPVLAMFIASAASLVLLSESVWRVLTDLSAGGHAVGDGGLLTAASISATLFFLVLIVNLLARRLSAQEELARRRGEDLRNQLSLNQLVIAELDQGVVVFDSEGALKTLNPKARQFLRLSERDETTAIDDAGRRMLANLRALVGSNQTSADVGVGAPGEPQRRFRARVLTAGGAAREQGDIGGDRVVLLEDMAQFEERAQQLKLASMGRMSASIAHEIRNPLGAIRHAGGLLGEQVAEPRLKRLTQIIEQNSVRIDRIVEDVLSISRRSAAREPIDLPDFFSLFLPEFVAQSASSWERISLDLSCEEPLLFDPNHLRQVLVNLLGNALRFASDSQGAIVVQWALREHPSRRDAPAPVLRIIDDGPGVPASDRGSLFEPFFTTDARGTGLGLHMAQELCSSNDAELRYEPLSSARYSGAFVIEPRSQQTDTADAVQSRRSGWQQKQTA